MLPYQLIFVFSFFGTSAFAMEEGNSIQINPPRKLMIAILVPVDRNIQSTNENDDEVNENIENSTGDGKKKILMEVGHPKNDKLNFHPEGLLDGEKENVNLETMTNRKRRSHMHHLGGGCLGGCGIGGGYMPGGGIGGGEIGGHGGQSGSFSTAQASSSSSSWSEGGGSHHKIGYGKK